MRNWLRLGKRWGIYPTAPTVPNGLTTDTENEACLFIRSHFSTFPTLANIVERADGDRYI